MAIAARQVAAQARFPPVRENATQKTGDGRDAVPEVQARRPPHPSPIPILEIRLATKATADKCTLRRANEARLALAWLLK
jgi:hypothetical protein